MVTVSTCQWSRTAWCIAARLPTCATSESEIEVSDGVKPGDQVVLTLRPVDPGTAARFKFALQRCQGPLRPDCISLTSSNGLNSSFASLSTRGGLTSVP